MNPVDGRRIHLDDAMTYPPPPGQLPPPTGDPQYPTVGYGAPYAPPYQPEYPPQYQPQYQPQYAPGYPPYGAGYQAYPAYPVQPAPVRVSPPALGWVLVGVSVLAVLAATMPWATVGAFGFSLSISGTDGDGVLCIVCAVVVAIAGAFIGVGQGRLWASITACVFATFVLLIGLVDMADLARLTNSDALLAGSASIGVGLVLTVVSGGLLLIASIAAIVKRSVRP